MARSQAELYAAYQELPKEGISKEMMGQYPYLKNMGYEVTVPAPDEEMD